MILTVDVGNTNITLGAYKDNKLLFVSRLATDRSRTKDQYAVEMLSILNLHEVTPLDFEGAIISCVVPELSVTIQRAVKIVSKHSPLIVGPGLKTGLNIKTEDPAILGADLVADAVGAINMYKTPCLVWDLGTATKISVIDETGAFLGCTIGAGVSISIEALATKTSQLPQISIDAPSSAIGKNSVNSMRSGVVFGTVAMLDGLSDRIMKELGLEKMTIVATGGLSKGIVCHSTKEITYNQNLVLDGLKIIYDMNSAKKSKINS